LATFITEFFTDGKGGKPEGGRKSIHARHPGSGRRKKNGVIVPVLPRKKSRRGRDGVIVEFRWRAKVPKTKSKENCKGIQFALTAFRTRIKTRRNNTQLTRGPEKSYKGGQTHGEELVAQT